MIKYSKKIFVQKKQPNFQEFLETLKDIEMIKTMEYFEALTNTTISPVFCFYFLFLLKNKE